MVASLLLIHDLYPVALEERVVEALDSVRPYMESHGGDVELPRASRTAWRACGWRAAAAAARRRRPRWSWRSRRRWSETAPDLLGMEVEGVEEPPTHGPPDIGGTPLPLAGGANGAAVPELAGWQDLDGVAGLPDGQMAAQARGGQSSCWWPT